MISTLGRIALRLVRESGEFALFLARVVWSLVGLRATGAKIIRAVFEMGVRSLPIVLIVGGFTGLVLGLQGYHTLTRFGSESLLGATVAISLVRELGPVLTALMLTGQAGSALAAEIGIQRTTEQIDALDTMGANPLGYLVAPRFVAALIVFPIHTALFDLVGIAGGYVSGSLMLPLSGGVYWQSVLSGVTAEDVNDGFCKALVFGAAVVLICAYQGYNTHRKSGLPGARGVSLSTTHAVVLSSVAVLATDYLLTSMLF